MNQASRNGLLSAILITALNTTPARAGLILTGVYDGPLIGGQPKGVELYASSDIADLSTWGLGKASNGDGSTDVEFSFPAVSVSQGTHLYVATRTSGFHDFFGFDPDYVTLALSINGDDAIELFQNGVLRDVFGDADTDGTGQPWEYRDGWAYRRSATGPNSGTFDITHWAFSGPGAWDGEARNSTAAAPFPIGRYTAASVPEASVLSTLGMALFWMAGLAGVLRHRLHARNSRMNTPESGASR